MPTLEHYISHPPLFSRGPSFASEASQYLSRIPKNGALHILEPYQNEYLPFFDFLMCELLNLPWEGAPSRETISMQSLAKEITSDVISYLGDSRLEILSLHLLPYQGWTPFKSSKLKRDTYELFKSETYEGEDSRICYSLDYARNHEPFRGDSISLSRYHVHPRHAGRDLEVVSNGTLILSLQSGMFALDLSEAVSNAHFGPESLK